MNKYFNGKGTIGFTCDVCGRELNGCQIVNGMTFCAKCYQETFGKDNQQNEIQQLKQQLAEKDKEIAHLKEKDNYHLRYELAGADETITNLKQQLEEKNKEIERLKFFERIYYQNQLQASQEDINKLFQSAYQSPIAVGLNEIAIQELEKVKNYFIEECEDGDGIKTEDRVIKKDIYEVADFIENQIKELKGEKDVKD